MRAIGFGLLVAISASAAQAATFHNISVRAECGSNLDVTSEALSTSALGAGASVGPPANSGANCSAGASAEVRSGTVRVGAFVTNPGDDDSPVAIRGAASAYGQLFYSFRFIPSKLDPDPLTVSINMNATGSAGASSNMLISDNGAFLNSGQIVSAGLRAFGTLSSGRESVSFEERIGVRVNPGQSDSDALGGNFTTAAISVVPGALVSFTFGLDGGTSGFLFGAEAKGEASAMRSLSFATDRPVFNIPDGYAIEFDEPTLVNNRYFGPDGPPSDPVDPVDPIDPLTPVPLPAAGWALLTALMGLVALKRRRSGLV
ncbi:MAG: VPLPA-CTERM sorting domain-containing protein [Pseudomonadota bacterium]